MEFKAKLLPHQQLAIDWAEGKKAALFGLKMGFGKTAIGMYLALNSTPKNKTIWITAKSLMQQTIDESYKFIKTPNICKFHGSSRYEHSSLARFHNSSFIITTFETLVREFKKKDSVLFHGPSAEFNTVIVDEAHLIRNETYRATATIAINANFRWLLTATPIMNNINDLRNLNRFMRHEQLFSTELFFFYDIDINLPKLNIEDVYVDLSEKQKQLQNEVIKSDLIHLVKLTRLRQLAIDADCWSEDEDDEAEAFSDSGKLSFILDIQDIHIGKKIIVFSNFTKPLVALNKILPNSYLVVGKCNEFKKWSSDPRSVFLLVNYKAGGLGLNMVQASVVIHLDVAWNLPTIQQATARCHRLGQTCEVYQYNLISSNSIEELLIKRNNPDNKDSKLLSVEGIASIVDLDVDVDADAETEVPDATDATDVI